MDDMNTLRKQNPEALRRALGEMRNRLQVLRMKAGANQLKDVREIRELRQAIARHLTILSPKQT